MIISASRRTDIPGLYSEWLLRRLRSGFAVAPNPWNPHRLGRVTLSPDNVDCIVFWTKNARPMLDKLSAIDDLGYRYYFSFTVTPYGDDVEKNLPPKKRIVDAFRELSDRLGPKRVDWRLDPIVVDARHTEQWHFDAFDRMCVLLGGRTERCIVNFVRTYRHLSKRVKEADDAVVARIASGFAEIARTHRVPLYNCTEKWRSERSDIRFAACIDKAKIEEIVGYPLAVRKDPGQPALCRCVESFDIGMYNTCSHGCAYCYAVNSEKQTRDRIARHDRESPMLSGFPSGADVCTERTRPSFRSAQPRLFD